VKKDKKKWDNYQRSNIALECSQGVEEDLDSTYIPTQDDIKLLFAAKQKFLYAVFEQTKAGE
jgi:hypothetical protein